MGAALLHQAKGKECMNSLTLIYLIGALALGFLAGMILELIIDAQTIRELQEDNRRLRLLNQQVTNQKDRVEVIEINDNRKDEPVQNYFKPF